MRTLLGRALTGALVLALASAAGAADKDARKCRRAIGSRYAKLVHTGQAVTDACHRLRDAGKSPGDCNDLAAADGSGRYARARDATARSVDGKCAPGNVVLANYATGDVDASLFPVIEGALEERAVSLLGAPSLVGDKTKVKCHAAVARLAARTIDDVVKRGVQCQSRLDKRATSFGAIQTSCVVASGSKFEKPVAKACVAKGVAGADVGSCDALPGCVTALASEIGRRVVTAIYRNAPPPIFSLDDALIPTPTLAATALLNEVRCLGAPGAPQFVELKGAAADQLAGGLVLENDAGQTYALPATVVPADASGIVTVLFDGESRVDGDVVHADRASFLATTSGFVVLRGAGGAELDRVSWGGDRRDDVADRGTGFVAPIGVGTSLARRPQAVLPSQVNEWFVASGPYVSPGRPNRNLGVRALLPLDGTLVEAGQTELGWIPVPGVARFHLQVAGDPGFANVVVDEPAATNPATVNLAPGVYHWRAQAVLADGSRADFSPANSVDVRAQIPEGDAPEANAGPSPRPAARGSLSRAVPLYKQRKDTPMLLLESDVPTGSRQAWDAPHPDLDKDDPADRTNCALASISMVNGYFAGASDVDPRLSQDRIGFEVFRGFVDGPEWDQNYGRGLDEREVTQGLTFALGQAPAVRPVGDAATSMLEQSNLYEQPDYLGNFWRDLLGSLAADRPMVVGLVTGTFLSGKHVVVAVGAFVLNRVPYVRLNDPWVGRRNVPLASLRILTYWILPDGVAPRADEDELRSRRDSDGDGIMDFDERRFGTRFQNPDRDRDTDNDCLDDLAEVRASVFDPRHGWGEYWGKAVRGLPVRSDARARAVVPRPELDGITADSDGGGLPDTMEDLDGDGRYEPESGETDPQVFGDDARTIKGYYLLFRDWLDSPGSGAHTEFDMRVEMDIRVTAAGKIEGTGDVTHHFRIFYADLPPYPQCNVGKRTRLLQLASPLTYRLALKAHFICRTIVIEPAPPFLVPAQPITVTDSCEPPGTGSTNLASFGGLTAGPPIIESGRVTYRSISAVRDGPQTHFDHELTVER